MSVQTDLEARTRRLQRILDDSNDALTAKGGDEARDLYDLPSAIEALPTGTFAGKLQNKAVTPTGQEITVTPDTGFDGLGSVTVAGDANLVPENIKEGIPIYGVTGTATGGGTAETEFCKTRAGLQVSNATSRCLLLTRPTAYEGGDS